MIYHLYAWFISNFGKIRYVLVKQFKFKSLNIVGVDDGQHLVKQPRISMLTIPVSSYDKFGLVDMF